MNSELNSAYETYLSLPTPISLDARLPLENYLRVKIGVYLKWPFGGLGPKKSELAVNDDYIQ